MSEYYLKTVYFIVIYAAEIQGLRWLLGSEEQHSERQVFNDNMTAEL